MSRGVNRIKGKVSSKGDLETLSKESEGVKKRRKKIESPYHLRGEQGRGKGRASERLSFRFRPITGRERRRTMGRGWGKNSSPLLGV